MSSEFSKVVILGRRDDARVIEPMKTIAAHLTKRGLQVFYEGDVDPTDTDLVVAIGGDGTMLYAAAQVAEGDVPLLGINRGRLGFLADVTPDEMITSIDHVLAGNYTRDSRLQLEAHLKRGDGTAAKAMALNDVVLQRRDTGRMVDFETSVNGVYVNTHSGDGLVVSTPTGSTAYALSCGGPIIEPRLDAIVVVPVCPHTLTDRPIVIGANEDIEVKLIEREDTHAEISTDGHSMGEILPGDTLVVSAAKSRVTFIHPPGYDYFEILRSKLYWGRDTRNRGNRARKN